MNTAISATHSEAAFFRNRKAMLVYPAIILPFIIALFWLFGGGKGERAIAEDAAAKQTGSNGFNASVPQAKNGSIDGREVEEPGYGKAQVGQTLSAFTNTHQDSTSKGLKAITVSNPVPVANATSSTEHASSLVSTPVALTRANRMLQSNHAVIAATRTSRGRAARPYQYKAPGTGYYTATATDQQLDAQLRQYQAARPQPVSTIQSQPEPVGSAPDQQESKTATVQVSDNLTASRLAEPLDAEDVFHTAPTAGSRRNAERAVLSGGNSYGAKKTIAWMIPVVVHDDQAIQEGQPVKLRLLKEITADGVTIPSNTILYAVCQLADDRLRLSVRSLQLGGQLISLDLDVYDTDGLPGVNVPGLSSGSQVGGQVRSSAIQGVQLPGIGGLASTVLNSARMGASQSARQTTIRLRAGYNLFLKAQ